MAKRAMGIAALRRPSLESMKLQILSDPHLEMLKPPYSWRTPETAAEVIVLAGDIGVGVMGVKWAVREAERLQKFAVYVAGNHEYYGERLKVLEKMKAVARGSRVYVLDLDEVTLGGVRFLGATLWTDYLASGRNHRPDAMEKAARFLNDHRLINRPHGFTPSDALEHHERGRAWLEAKLATRWDGPTVVVSHHAPSLIGTDMRFRKDYLTAAFVSDLEDLIETCSPTLWIHGHTHYCAQYVVGHTRVAANQKDIAYNTLQ
jgi:predicted phosphodiesterase